jgi:hypothetical protein
MEIIEDLKELINNKDNIGKTINEIGLEQLKILGILK